MDAAAAFLALTEYRADERLAPGTGLFAARLPRRLDPAAFGENALLRRSGDQLGLQVFFTAHGRPFCLYVVVGSPSALRSRIGELNALLAGLAIGDR